MKSILKQAIQRHGRRIFSAVAITMACSASSAALAQNCTTTQTGTFIPNLGTSAVPAGAASAALAGAIGNVNTAFLTQQGSAFVSAPGNPKPDQPGGGIWVRGVGGEVNLKTNSASTGVATVNGAPVNNSTTQCANTQHLNFAGIQVGADIARLNWSGWNVHLGTTAGYLGAKSTDNNGFSNTYDVPFFGTYLVATKGRFFADLMVRQEFYNINLSNAGLTYFNQPVGARGYSISASTGYNADLGNGWFVEPSAGFIYANTSVDSFVNSGSAALGIPGTISTNNVISEIGRASLRVGKTIETPNVIWQPFASASVFHEFAGSVVSNYASLPNSAFIGPDPASFTQRTVTSRVGTYGQYSLGIAGQIVGTGLLGFARVDYRNGDNIDGWTGNAGIRYQFTPEMVASVMPTKVKAPSYFIAPTSWTGFYAGIFGGAAGGRTDIGFVGDPGSGNNPWVQGGIGGIQIGYNRQFNNWVLGVEADAGAANIRGGRPAGTANGLDATGASVGFSPAFFTVQDKTNWMATVTGRVGYASGRTLYYAEGWRRIRGQQPVGQLQLRTDGDGRRQDLSESGPGRHARLQHREQDPRRLDAGLRHRVRPRQELVGQGRVQLYVVRRGHRTRDRRHHHPDRRIPHQSGQGRSELSLQRRRCPRCQVLIAAEAISLDPAMK